MNNSRVGQFGWQAPSRPHGRAWQKHRAADWRIGSWWSLRGGRISTKRGKPKKPTRNGSTEHSRRCRSRTRCVLAASGVWAEGIFGLRSCPHPQTAPLIGLAWNRYARLGIDPADGDSPISLSNVSATQTREPLLAKESAQRRPRTCGFRVVVDFCRGMTRAPEARALHFLDQ